MTFAFPQFDQPNALDSDRTWVAIYDSYDQRNDDAYYVIVVSEGGYEVCRFTTRIALWWAGDDWTDAQFINRLRVELHAMAGKV